MKENPYLQLFLGVKEYFQNEMFSASTLIDFRRRFGEDVNLLDRINQHSSFQKRTN